jgi:hypothetical protein
MTWPSASSPTPANWSAITRLAEALCAKEVVEFTKTEPGPAGLGTIEVAFPTKTISCERAAQLIEGEEAGEVHP